MKHKGNTGRGWPKSYVESFTGAHADFKRPPQGKVEKREEIVVVKATRRR